MNKPTNFANNSPSSLTLRELRAIVRNPQIWAGLAIVTIILAISGPFNTQNLLNLPERLVYWALVSVSTFFIGIAISSFVSWTGQVWGLSATLGQILGGLLAGIPITLWIWLVNHFGFGFDMGGMPEFVRLLLYCIIITMCVTVGFGLISNTESSSTDGINQSSMPGESFFARLTKPIGTDLISLQAKDHYLEVTTSAGTDLILLRLGDAEKELSNYDGLRIHRSHWVATQHVKDKQRVNGAPVVTMTNGTEFSVSRSYVKSAREAGII